MTNSLNIGTYDLLIEANIDAYPILTSSETIDWYQLTYDLFTNAPLENINDFWKIVAYAYSWMPTIPSINSNLVIEPDILIRKLNELKTGNLSELPTLLKLLIPVINNSLTGTSKVLHFIAPDFIPIIDSNVLRGYEIFFFKLNMEYDVPKLPSYKTSLNNTHIGKYLTYVDLLKKWVAECDNNITIRDIEFELFQLGKNTVHEKHDLPIYKIE